MHISKGYEQHMMHKMNKSRVPKLVRIWKESHRLLN